MTLAKFKLLGGVASQWVDIKKNEQLASLSALAVLASIADLYLSPLSCLAPNLVKSHMATLIGLDESHQWHVITYPSEPLLSEAGLEVFSEDNAKSDILKELDSAARRGGIYNPGNQGELVVRILFVSAWSSLVCSERKKSWVSVKLLD